jgi:hypothetical protein
MPEHDQIDAMQELAREIRYLREQLLMQLGTKDNPGTLVQALEAIEARLGEHHGSLYGWQDKPGAMTRIDRIESSMTNFKWVIGLGATGGVALLVDAFKRFFFSHP